MGCSWPFWSDKLITLKFYGYFEHCTVVYLVRGRFLTTSTKICNVLTTAPTYSQLTLLKKLFYCYNESLWINMHNVDISSIAYLPTSSCLRS